MYNMDFMAIPQEDIHYNRIDVLLTHIGNLALHNAYKNYPTIMILCKLAQAISEIDSMRGNYNLHESDHTTSWGM